ncbi:Uncharacterized protein APZ42_001538 [Daphnia magna]|uniref:Uncharacterized protein n=1 Tax=Daphnia magna TaxID=35525 RepID=A0A162D0B7_9CRUS|nr:Uncharacterized protein APZ42_001538 [Daphnia magna]
MQFGLPCHHIIRFHLERQTEIPAEAFLHHWRNRCLEYTILIFFQRNNKNNLYLII